MVFHYVNQLFFSFLLLLLLMFYLIIFFLFNVACDCSCPLSFSSLLLLVIEAFDYLVLSKINSKLWWVFNYKIVQLEGTENSVYLDVLRLFAHGTWSDYKSKQMKFCIIFYFYFFLSVFLFQYSLIIGLTRLFTIYYKK